MIRNENSTIYSWGFLIYSSEVFFHIKNSHTFLTLSLNSESCQNYRFGSDLIINKSTDIAGLVILYIIFYCTQLRFIASPLHVNKHLTETEAKNYANINNKAKKNTSWTKKKFGKNCRKRRSFREKNKLIILNFITGEKSANKFFFSERVASFN